MILRRSKSNEIENQFNKFELQFNFQFDRYNKFYNEFGQSYLDKFVYIKHKKICLRWYRKEDAPEVFLNFRSAAPVAWKKSTVIGGYRRIIDSCTSEEGLDVDINRFQEMLRKNGYTKQFINSLNNILQTMMNEQPKLNTEKIKPDGPKINLKIPFHHQIIHDKLILMENIFVE